MCVYRGVTVTGFQVLLNKEVDILLHPPYAFETQTELLTVYINVYHTCFVHGTLLQRWPVELCNKPELCDLKQFSPRYTLIDERGLIVSNKGNRTILPSPL